VRPKSDSYDRKRKRKKKAFRTQTIVGNDMMISGEKRTTMFMDNDSLGWKDLELRLRERFEFRGLAGPLSDSDSCRVCQ
jgi:hypothetical protein